MDDAVVSFRARVWLAKSLEIASVKAVVLSSFFEDAPMVEASSDNSWMAGLSEDEVTS